MYKTLYSIMAEKTNDNLFTVSLESLAGGIGTQNIPRYSHRL